MCSPSISRPLGPTHPSLLPAPPDDEPGRKFGFHLQQSGELVQQVIDPLVMPLNSRGGQDDETPWGDPQFSPIPPP